MRISFDEPKRRKVLKDRGLDLAEAGTVFAGFHLTRSDDKHSDVEDRFVSVGDLNGTVVIVIWTRRDDERRIVTMWKANDREREIYRRHRDRPG